MERTSRTMTNAGGNLVRSHAIDHIVKSMKNLITLQMESRYDLWGVLLDKEKNSVMFVCPTFLFLVENVGNVKEYIPTLRQNPDEDYNEGFDKRFVFYSWFYEGIEPYFISNPNPEQIIKNCFETINPVGSLTFSIAAILNTVHKIEKSALVRTRMIIGEDIVPVRENKSAFIIFKEENGRKVYVLNNAKHITFSISKDSTIPEEEVVPGEVYECALEKMSADFYYIDVLRRSGRGKLAINYVSGETRDDCVFDTPKRTPIVNKFEGLFEDLMITTPVIHKEPKIGDDRMPVVHLGTEETYTILISLYRIGFREVEIILPEPPLKSVILHAETKDGLVANVVLGVRDYVNSGYQRG